MSPNILSNPPEQSNYEKFQAKYKPLIEETLNKQIESYDNRDKILKALQGGKRLRAMLCFLAFKVSGGSDDTKGAKVAASAELFQNVSLMKDDILDIDKVRRDNPASWVEHGPLETMRTADSMIIAGLESIAEFGSNILKTLLGGWRGAWQGEAQDYGFVKGLQNINGPMYEMYFKVIRRKTAVLFATSAKMGAQAAEAYPKLVDLLYQYGEDLGVAYQLADDAVDLKKGKVELLPTLFVAQLDATIKEQFLGGLAQGRLSIGEALLGAGFNANNFLKTELKNYLAKIKIEAGNSEIPNTEFKPILAEYPVMAVRAMLKEAHLEDFLQ